MVLVQGEGELLILEEWGGAFPHLWTWGGMRRWYPSPWTWGGVRSFPSINGIEREWGGDSPLCGHEGEGGGGFPWYLDKRRRVRSFPSLLQMRGGGDLRVKHLVRGGGGQCRSLSVIRVHPRTALKPALTWNNWSQLLVQLCIQLYNTGLQLS